MIKNRASHIWYIVAMLVIFVAVVSVISVLMLTRGSQAPSLSAGLVTIKGEVLCLPHKDTNGPQTLECAMGIKDDQGHNYALSDTDQNYANISSLQTGKTVEVTGTLKAADDSKYQIKGILQITKIELLQRND